MIIGIKTRDAMLDPFDTSYRNFVMKLEVQ